MTARERKDKMTAAGATLLVALALLLFLLFNSLTWNRAALTQASIPDEQEEEEIFLEPELLNLGEEDAVTHDEPAPNPQGEPEPAETDNDRLVIPGENPKPAPLKEKLVSTPKESDVKATEPKATDKEREKITSTMAKGFSSQSGKPDGKDGSAGSGGEGLGIVGSARGRVFKGCPAPDVTLRHKLTVTVNVTVNEQGTVTAASAQGGATAEIRRACEKAAMRAQWSPKKGAGETRGTITFTITPRV